MSSDINIVKCPNCGTDINVSDILYSQVQEQLNKDFEEKNKKKDDDYKERLQELESKRDALNKEKENVQAEIEDTVKIKLEAEKITLEKSIRNRINEEKDEQVKSLEDELKLKSEQVKELNKTRAEISKLQREKDELKEKIEAEESEKFNTKLIEEREKIKVNESEKSKTELQKRDKLIDDLNKRLEDAQIKLEQGSNKLSGEVKEIELRDFLKSTFPLDEITDIASGVTGADVLHKIKNNSGQFCGTILYERKQTQSFGKDWISKLKEDGLRSKADICIIVTRAMPKENKETHFNDGVWISSFTDIKIISTLLRDGLIKQYSALVSESNKGTKMEMLYNYLRSNDFQNHITGILDAFRKMDKSVNKEREEASKKFAEREAHIWQAKQSVISFWGRVDGIATDSLNLEMKSLNESNKDQITQTSSV